jgi:hypothetical protein
VHQLSRQLGRVQYYNQNRALNHHAWALANDGQILRAYAWAGDTLWHQGRKTKDEIELGMTCLGYTEERSEFEFSQASAAAQNTEKLPMLAARWSVDPGAVDARYFRELTGMAGEASLSIAY